MGQGDLELQKNKKPVEIKATRDAEDVVRGPNVAFMIQRPMELDVHSQREYTGVMNNPLVNREMKRRRQAGGEEAEWDYQMQIIGQNPHEVLDQAEKNWVSEGLEKLTQKAEENRRAEQERLRKEAQERKERELLEKESKEREERERLEQERKERLEKERRARERLYIEDNLNMTYERLSVHIPAETVLSLKYSSRFSSSVSDKRRREKQKNPKSRLYQKIKNADLLEKNISERNRIIYRLAQEQTSRDDDISAEDFNDMAQFMTNAPKYGDHNRVLSELMLGGRNAEGKRSVDAYHARLALTKMADMLLDFDVKSVRLDTDHDIAANAVRLETLTNRLAAFSRLSGKYDYMDSLDQVRRQALFVRLQELRTIAAYYTVRKEIIGNKMYRDHYDSELSMDVSRASNDEQRALAEKLVKSFILGRNMMRINGIPVRVLGKMRDPHFKNAQAAQFFTQTQRDYDELNTHNYISLVKDGYTGLDEQAAQILEQMREEPVMRQEQEIAIDQPIESEEQAEQYNKQVAQKQDQKDAFADGVMKTLLTSDELIPLKGTRDMAAVRNSINALQAMLTNEMPPVRLNEKGEVDTKAEAKAREEIDGTCIAVVMLYKRMTDSIDRLVARYGSAYSDLAAMLKDLSDQCKSESDRFREKVLEYRSIVSEDAGMRSGTRTWMDAVKFNRGVFYDLDNDKTLEVKREGAGASSLLKITRTVPVTEENPEGQETVYFRTRDKVPPADNKEFVANVMARHEVSEETSKKLTHAILAVHKNVKVLGQFADLIKEHKVKHTSYDEIGKDILGRFNKVLKNKLDIPEKEYETVGRIIVDWRDDIAKRAMAHDMSISAKIENGRPLADRNVVISRLARMFGIGDMACDSRTATVRMNGKVIEGNIMENTGGVETGSKTRPYTQKAISQLFILQTFDFIGGQTDRHFGNFHAKVRDEQYDQIRFLDNDMSCGLLKPGRIGNRQYNFLLPVTDVALMGLPLSFVNRMMGIDRAYLDQVVGDILDKQELDAMEERLNYVKMRLISLAQNNPDANWDESTRQFSYTGYMADEAYRQLWAVDNIQTKAYENDQDMGYISKFRTRNMEVTPIGAMMTERRRILDAQARQGDKRK